MSLEQDPLIVDIKAKINDEITRITDWLTDGKADSYSDYKRACGLIRGRKNSLSDIDDCIKNYLRDDDE
jgi:hypothetical protein